MRRQKSVYQGWKGTSGLLGYLDIIRCLVGPCGGVCDSFRSGSYVSIAVNIVLNVVELVNAG
jgi:hypothetical protein